jgi:osmotically-inducible protein OsmY
MRQSCRLFLTGLLFSGIALGCTQQPGLDSADAAAAKDTLQQAARTLGKALTKVKQGLDDAELAGKVYVRILWDQHLQEAKVSVDAKPGGIVTVRGKVPSRTIRRGVLDLAESTVGVTQVLDEIEVDPDMVATRPEEEAIDPTVR